MAGWKMYATVVDKSCTHRYPQKLLRKPSSLPTQQTTRNLLRKRFSPDELSRFQQRDVIRTFQDLNESITPAVFQFKN